MSSADEEKQHITCTDEFNNMYITCTDEIDRCANCSKEGNDLNICNRCKMVKYCNVSCKKKHKSKHKKKCDRRVAELQEEVLFKDHPPNEDCPICVLPLPLDDVGSTFQPCCGKLICIGCIVSMMKEDKRKGKKKFEDHICAFCIELPKQVQMKREIEGWKSWWKMATLRHIMNLPNIMHRGLMVCNKIWQRLLNYG